MFKFWFFTGSMCRIETSSDVLFRNINQFEFWDFEIFSSKDFLGTPNAQPTLPHYQSIAKHYCVESCCPFFRPKFKHFALLERKNKQVPSMMFHKKPFWLFTLEDWWRHRMQKLDRIQKIMLRRVSNTYSAFQSECVKTRKWTSTSHTVSKKYDMSIMFSSDYAILPPNVFDLDCKQEAQSQSDIFRQCSTSEIWANIQQNTFKKRARLPKNISIETLAEELKPKASNNWVWTSTK